MSDGSAGLGVALRRVVVGYRVVGLLWLWLLATIVLVSDDPNVWIVVATGLGATAWTVATVTLAARAPVLLRTLWWLVADVAVACGVILLSSRADADRGFSGGYPFAAVVLGGYAAGYPGAFLAASILSIVSLTVLGGGEAIGSTLVYFAGAGVFVWGTDVLRRSEAQQRALEQALAAEEAERVRSQERADTAAALHDSVLQTLALIQRRSEDPAAVASLARRQERDLRDWLTGRDARLGAGGDTTFAAAVTTAAADVERDYPITVEVVTVGDAPLTDELRAAVAATKEAVVNVAKHAGVPTASVYAEVSADSVTVYVRDRGTGFEPASVTDDRRGISESMVARMARHGGVAAIASSPGGGTEVELHMPLTAGA